MRLPKNGQQFFVRNLFQVEFHLDGFAMAGLAVAHLGEGRVFGFSIGESAGDREDSRDATEDGFQAPKGSARQISDIITRSILAAIDKG